MRIDVVTLFPGMFDSVLGSSILKRAAQPVANPADAGVIREPVVSYHLHDPRAYSTDKHGKVDQSPYGGGPGMVLQCQPIFDCVVAAEAQQPELKATRIVMTPKGAPLTQPMAEHLAKQERLLIIAGHYEGFDQRVLDELEPIEVSVGDYVLTGGELPAMVLIDAVVRLLPGALGDSDSSHHDSFSPGSANDAGQRLLDHPHYTRPAEWRGRDVPEVLLSGDHGKIAAWRKERALELTQARRPDLLRSDPLTDNEPRPSGSGPACASNSGTGSAPSRPPLVVLRDMLPGDADAIDAVLRAAFPSDDEARLVRTLREQGDLPIELVAEVGGNIVGHVAFSPVTVAPTPDAGGQAFSNPHFRALALAPLAVHPHHQRRGIGHALASLGLRTCDDARIAGVFVLGEPGYYAALGFEPAEPLGYTNPFGGGDAFRVRLFNQAEPAVGAVQYAPAFDALGA
ncbi:tRNA (guanosine(37)-N1)-methyltransferase TrmD [Phycisphaeraceae bacterium D3-23]